MVSFAWICTAGLIKAGRKPAKLNRTPKTEDLKNHMEAEDLQTEVL